MLLEPRRAAVRRDDVSNKRDRRRREQEGDGGGDIRSSAYAAYRHVAAIGLDHLLVSQTRVGGIDLNKARMRAVMAALSALAVSPEGFTVSELSAKVQAMTGPSATDYSIRQASYDLRKLRAKRRVDAAGRAHTLGLLAGS